MKNLYTTFDKAKLNTLPRALFTGRIFIVQSEYETARAADYLLSQPILGFDTETRPSFKKGLTHSVALLQVATHDTCFLFRLNLMAGLPQPVVRLLESLATTKVGLSLKDDFGGLQRRADFRPQGFVELQDEVKQLGIQDMSLQKIFANLFGQKIAKNQQLSNWEADALTEAQQRYAATDAWACICIHEEINRLLTTQDYTLQDTIL